MIQPGALAPITGRAATFALLIPLALLFGEPLARLLQFDALAARAHRFAATCERRLNRPGRSPRAKFWRGFIALFALLLPAAFLGALLWQPSYPFHILCCLVLVALLGHVLPCHTLLARWRQAKQGKLLLETGDRLFNDTYGVLRQAILMSASGFTQLIGCAFWFALGGAGTMFAYLALRFAAGHFAPRGKKLEAFGWATWQFSRAASVIPDFIAKLLLLLAGLFVPRTHPLRALGQLTAPEYGVAAALLGLSLGGPARTGAGEHDLPWLGDGTPKPEAIHLTLWVALLSVALFLALLALLAASLGLSH